MGKRNHVLDFGVSVDTKREPTKEIPVTTLYVDDVLGKKYLDVENALDIDSINFIDEITLLLNKNNVTGVQYSKKGNKRYCTPVISSEKCLLSHDFVTLGNPLSKEFLASHLSTVNRDDIVFFLQDPRIQKGIAGTYMQYGIQENFLDTFPEYNDDNGGWGDIEINPED